MAERLGPWVFAMLKANSYWRRHGRPTGGDRQLWGPRRRGLRLVANRPGRFRADLAHSRPRRDAPRWDREGRADGATEDQGMKRKTHVLKAVFVAAAVVAGGDAARAQAPADQGNGEGYYRGYSGAGAPAPSEEITPTQPKPWGWIKMPKLHMPKIEMPKMPADPLAPIKTSARKVGDGTKRAWEGTKEIFRGGSKDAEPRVATQGEAPSMWQRMFGPKEEPQPEGPRTVAEWMAQPRLDP
jgi:hypothetical protein